MRATAPSGPALPAAAEDVAPATRFVYEDGPLKLGPRLKAARNARSLSLRGLGERTGFSASFLSQVELGQASPSLASLGRIAQALGLSLANLLAEPAKAPGPVVRRRNAEVVRSEWSRAVVQSLLPGGGDDRIGAVLVELEPGGRSGKMSAAQKGSELAFCVRGKVALTIDEVRYDLAAGDSMFYDASRPLVWENAGQKRAELLLVTVRLP